MKEKLPTEIRLHIIPLPTHDPMCDVKVKCPICDEEMLPFTVEPRDTEKPVMKTICSFRMCPRCGSHFSFSHEAQEIIWKRVNK